MAGASMKDIKMRIKSVESTMQITKAMELVASSKLRRAKERQERCRPYFTELRNTLDEIEATTNDFSSPYHANRTVKKACLIVIAGDRGLAGGFSESRRVPDSRSGRYLYSSNWKTGVRFFSTQRI